LGFAAAYAGFCPGTERGEKNLWEEIYVGLNTLMEPWHQRRTGCAGSWD